MIAVQISALTGWRAAWGINAGMLVAGVGVALMFLPRGKEKPLRTFRKRGEEKEKEAPVWRNRNLSLALPVVLASLYHHRLLLPPGEAGTGERLGAVVGGGMVYCLCHYPGGIAAVVWPAD